MTQRSHHSSWSGDFDTLASESSVRLFGKLMWDIILNPAGRRAAYEGPTGQSAVPPAVPPRLSKNNFLTDQLSDPNAGLARIYCFSYQNQLFDMAKPAIFLVHGEGTIIEVPNHVPKPENLFLRKLPTYSDRSGLAGQKGSFALGMKMWLYDRADFTVRLDTETGTFDQVLLDYELGGGVDPGSMKGADTDEVPRPNLRRRRHRRWRSSED